MATLAAALVSRLSSLSPPHRDIGDSTGTSASSSSHSSGSVSSASDTTPSSACANPSSSSPIASAVAAAVSKKPFDARSCASVDIASVSAAACAPELRANEHLAVLLPKHLWKPDSQASRCDIFLCRKPFSIFDRRHHCRKCGGVFCATCSTRTTALLDASALDFLHPPRGVPVAAFASPISPVTDARVCDACYDQIHGVRRPHHVGALRRGGANSRTTPISVHWDTDSASSSASCSPRSPPTPLDGSALITPATAPDSPPSTTATVRPPLRRAATTGSPRTPASPLRSASGRSTPIPTPIPLDPSTTAFVFPSPPSIAPPLDPSETLAAYPLCVASAVCKASGGGGGRWAPRASAPWVGYRVPGGKAMYEVEMEQEEESKRRRRMNPVVRTGEVMVRPMNWGRDEDEEEEVAGGPYTLSTF